MLACLLAVTRGRCTATGWEGSSLLIATTLRGTQPGSQDGETCTQLHPASPATPTAQESLVTKHNLFKHYLLSGPVDVCVLCGKASPFSLAWNSLWLSVTIPIFTCGKQGWQLPLPFLPYTNGFQPLYPKKQKRHGAESPAVQPAAGERQVPAA